MSLADIPTLAALFVGWVLVVAGWYVGHILSSRRDQANKRRELRLTSLIHCYRLLESTGNRPLDPDVAAGLETAVADIQLFGTAAQVELAQRFARRFAQDRKADQLELLESLRTDLRSELNLEDGTGKLVFLRITPPDEGK